MIPTTSSRPQVNADDIPEVANGRPLTETEIDALRDAKKWRATRDNANPQSRVVEPAGGSDRTPDPTRYGDWERDGRAIDFS